MHLGEQYFKTFFEIAAGIKLTDGTSTDQPEDEQDASLPQEQQSEAGDRTAMTEDESTVTEGPNTSAAYASFGQHDPSPFEQLQRDAEKQFGISSDPTKSPGASHAQQQQQQQYRPDGKRIRTRDLSFDSPDNTLDDTVDKPELETMSLDPSKVRQGKLNDVSAQEDSPFIAKPKPSSSAAKDKPPHGSVTAATAAKARTSTPAKAKYASPATSAKLASHLPPGWSAHKPTDLSKTPLTGQSTRSYQPSNISDVSSPPEMTYAFSHLPSKIARTPGKKAAQWMTQDILETAALQLGEHQEDPMSALDSPVIEPPSVIKNWDKRNYDRDAPESPIRGAPSASSSANKQHYGRVVDDDDDEGDHGQGSVVEHDDVSFGSIGDAPIEDWEQHEGKTADVSGDETHQLSEQMDSRLGGFDGVEEGEEDSFDQRQEAPDTLFGGRQQPRQLDRLDGFLKVHNAGEMHTLHGGRKSHCASMLWLG